MSQTVMSQLPFSNSIAIVIGIDNYSHGISPLQTAVNDSVALAALLEKHHGYEVIRLLNEKATNSAIIKLLSEYLPGVLQKTDRLLFYFAGHGVSVESDDGPAGYLIPQDGQRDNVETFLEMKALNQMLMALPCDHCLILLDSCFSGAFRWSTSMRRSMVAPEAQIYRERFDRFVTDPAWQVITSTSYDQTAMDVLNDGRGLGTTGQHSPFAEALLDGLKGEADSSGGRDKGKVVGDGVITAQELAIYLRDRVEPQVGDFRSHYQTPELWPLKRHDKGQYVFLVPGHKLNLPSAEKLTEETNPYRGLQSYDEEHSDLFYGRNDLIDDLKARVTDQPLTVVLGHSGTGKSSLVKAGLVPKLRQETESVWTILPPFRPGREPLQALAKALLTLQCEDIQSLGTTKAICEVLTQRPIQLHHWLQQWEKQNPGQKLLIVIDQFEELVTLCDDANRQQFLTILPHLIFAANSSRVILTLRSDFEAQFSESDMLVLKEVKQLWAKSESRFFVSPMTQDELRQAIEEPASQKVIYFEPHALVDQIINEVVQMPGALPLLSFTLSELYRKYLASGRTNRAMTLSEYESLGGVSGALTKRATEEYTYLCEEDKAFEQTVKHVMLRMVSLQGGELARRRVPLSELVYADKDKNERVQQVINQLATARLVIRGQEEEAEPYVEPAHDALVSGWQLLQQWRNEEIENIELRHLLTPSATEWQRRQKEKKAHGLLWNNNPRLPLLREYLKAESGWLNQREEEFIAKSEQRRKSERRRVISFVSLVIVVLSGISLYATRTAISERSARRDSTARRLKAEAQLEGERPNGSLTLSMLLALESLYRWPITAATDFSPIFEKSSLIPKTMMSMHHGKEGVNTVESVRFSPNNKLVASGGWDNTVRLWSTDTGNELFRGLHNDYVHDISFSSDGKRLASASSDNTIRVWDIETQTEIVKMLHDKAVKKVDFSPDNKIIASGGMDNAAILWDSSSGTEIVRQTYKTEITDLAFSSESTYFASASVEGKTCILNLRNLTPKICLDVQGGVQDIDFNSKGSHIAIASSNGKVIVFDFKSEEKTFEFDDGVNFTAVKFTPNGKGIAATEEDGTLHLWNLDKNTKTLHINGGELPHDLSFTPDGKHIIVNTGYLIQIWQVSDGKEAFRIKRDNDQPMSFSLNSDGNQLVSSYISGELRVWDIGVQQKENVNEAKNNLFPLEIKHSKNLQGAFLDENGGYVATVSKNEEQGQSLIKVSSISFGKEVFSVSIPGDVSNIVFNNSGDKIAIDSFEKPQSRTFEIWNLNTKEKQFSSSFNHGLNLIRFSSDNRKVAFSEFSSEPYLHVLDLQSGKRFQKQYNGLITNLDFSPDNSLLGIAVMDEEANGVQILDLEREEILSKIKVPSFPFDLEFSNVDDLLAVGYGSRGEDGFVSLFSFREKDVLKSSPDAKQRHQTTVSSLDFNPDGKTLLVGWSNGMVDLLNIEKWNDDSRVIERTKTFEGAIEYVNLSNDGHWAISKTEKGIISLWNLLEDRVVDRQQVKNTIFTSDSAFSRYGPIVVDVNKNIATVSKLSKKNPMDICERLDRNLTLSEWNLYLDDEPYSRTCPNLPWPDLPASDEDKGS